MLLKKDYTRIVIKIGASLLYAKDKLDTDFIERVAAQVVHLIEEGKEVALVSSGAIACGMSVLGLKARPKGLAILQAVAAVGQHELMYAWRKAFKEKGLNCAQVLLTWEDFNSRRRYLNAKNTLHTLLSLKSLPIINENDTVSTDEIKFGDNDRLSALVAALISADILIILSDVDGLLDKNKEVIKVVDEITPGIRSLACPTDKKVCVGGMITKIEAVKIAMDSGIPCVIANGANSGVILSAVNEAGKEGTLFLSGKDRLGAKKRWLAFSAKAKGRIVVDDGAKKALLNKKSLLSIGVTEVEGDFGVGDIVRVADSKNCEFAKGKVRLSSRQLDKFKGCRCDKEVIHCDNIVILR